MADDRSGSAQWGLARKLLNIYLRDCVYSAHLRSLSRLGLTEPPARCSDGRRLLESSEGTGSPRWLGVKRSPAERVEALMCCCTAL